MSLFLSVQPLHFEAGSADDVSAVVAKFLSVGNLGPSPLEARLIAEAVGAWEDDKDWCVSNSLGDIVHIIPVKIVDLN